MRCNGINFSFEDIVSYNLPIDNESIGELLVIAENLEHENDGLQLEIDEFESYEDEYLAEQERADKLSDELDTLSDEYDKLELENSRLENEINEYKEIVITRNSLKLL